ncbi:uncharacterized protein [Dermacentor andersoni]|uniref:uncharacterized protein isoform X2 n=1 Tax=Dermacentor andersoni TaxID=34620 RepID=UPI0024163F71|nr:uncharacterized protein LOC129383563 isoform X2 [Dermacentor andersoni]
MLEPEYVINRLPKLRCHMNTILREVSQNVDNETADRSVANVEENIAELQGVLNPHRAAYHYLEVVEKYPKVLVKRNHYSKLLSKESAEYYKKNVKCQDTHHLCALTKGQSMNLRWHRERRVRITCSMAHTILRTRKAPADLVNTLLRTTSFSSEATTYGIKMEALARKEFEDEVSVQVIETGLVLHSLQPWLAGSPDGLFLSDQKPCILEIKCPFSRKDDIIIDDRLEHSFVPYVKYVNGRLALLKSHKYYTQVQLLMYVCNVQSCYFFVYSSKQSIIIDIERDNSFLYASVRALEEFYFAWLLPAFARWRRV